MSDIQFITESAPLAGLVERLRDSDWIAVDTEFLSDRAYRPRLCLLQVATEEVIACVDVLRPLDLAPLWATLTEPSITKVFHAAENDLAVLLPAAGAMLAPVFDTQVAAAFCGHGETIGYADLVERFCGVSIDKSLARTDWSRRPLPGKALQYAADDVRYLRDVFGRLSRELEDRGRRAWAEEEFRDLADPARYREDPGEAWRRVRGHASLGAQGLTVLQGLAQWRELEARSTNRPRRWILSDEALCGISRRAPRTSASLDRVRGFEPGRHGAHRAALLALVEHGLAAARAEPAEAVPRSSPAALAHVLRGVVEHAAFELELPASLIAGFADLTRAAAGARDLRLFRGWRGERLGADLARFLDGEIALTAGPAGPTFTSGDGLSD